MLKGVKIIPFKLAAYNKKNKKVEIFCLDKKGDFEFISGSMMRRMAKEGKKPPEGFMNQKSWEILS